jgi:uncharacterized protein (DUF1800 family)
MTPLAPPPPSTIARHRRARRRVSANAPGNVRARAITSASVSLTWDPPAAHAGRHHRAARYDVLRDGNVLARVRETFFNDTAVSPDTAYRYQVRLARRHGRHGPRSASLLARTLRRARGAPVPLPPGWGASTGGDASPAPVPGIDSRTKLTQPMVDRLFWRAGFGPSPADRSTWVGRAVQDLVDWLITTPGGFRSSSTPPLTYDGKPIDPLVTDYELVLEWVDRMQRATNPLAERLNFFWHRHWAVSRNAGIPAEFLLSYRGRLLRYGDLGAHPDASFHDLAVEMTTQDAAMSFYLNGFENVAGAPNENYGREFMELFCLGVVNRAAQPNYTQADVQNLARAFTGWGLNQDPNSPNFGRVTFVSDNFDTGIKTVLGRTGALDAAAAVDTVLAHPAHAPFIVTKLWREFIASPIPDDALASLTQTYTSQGLRLAPLVRGILTHPLIFESLGEPNLVKPPIVYCVGLLRALSVPLQGTYIPDVLDDMQQLPYFPPNVAGWEGGLAWLNSNTVQARFDMLVRAQNLKYGLYPGAQALDDVPGETAQGAFDRAYASLGSPWLSDATRTRLLSYASAAPVDTPERARQRVYALQAFMAGGPDGQVM